MITVSMLSLTFCKLTSVKINRFALVAYIGPFTGYHRCILHMLGLLRILRCVVLRILQEVNVTDFQKSTNDRNLVGVAW